MVGSQLYGRRIEVVESALTATRGKVKARTASSAHAVYGTRREVTYPLVRQRQGVGDDSSLLSFDEECAFGKVDCSRQRKRTNETEFC